MTKQEVRKLTQLAILKGLSTKIALKDIEVLKAISNDNTTLQCAEVKANNVVYSINFYSRTIRVNHSYATSF